MAARRRTTTSRASRGLLGAGAISLTAALLLAPGASAEPGPGPSGHDVPGAVAGALDDSPSASPSAAPSAPTSPTVSASPTASSASPSASPTSGRAAVEPNYGSQKYRVGVQVKDGSYVPPGTTTVGTQIKIVEKGPNVSGGTKTTTCTTLQSTLVAGSTASYCVNTEPIPARAHKVEDGDSSIPLDELYTAQAGSTVTLRQVSVNANLLTDSVLDPATIEPCASGGEGPCEGDGLGGYKVTSVTFDDPGLPPVAKDDSARTQPGTSVDIAVLDNDSDGNGAPLTGFGVTSKPGHGTATVRGSAPAASPSPMLRGAAVNDARSIVYRPAKGFTGTDTFRYRIRTANGASTATVRVVVPGAPAAPKPASPTVAAASGTTTSSGGVLPDTGGPSAGLLGLGLGLLGAGGVLTVRGRRRGPAAG